MSYVTNNICHVNLQDISEQSLEIQIECCAIPFKIKDWSYCLLNVYKTYSGYIQIFLNQHDIICGDLNIRYVQDTKESKLLLDLLEDFICTPYSEEPTHNFTNSNESTSLSKIYYFFTTCPASTITEREIDHNMGDHLALLIDLKPYHTQKPYLHIQVLNKCLAFCNTWNRTNSKLSQYTDFDKYEN